MRRIILVRQLGLYCNYSIENLRPHRAAGGCLCFPFFTSELALVFGKGWCLYGYVFFVQLLHEFGDVKAAPLHPLQGRSQGKDGLFHSHGAVAVQGSLFAASA